MRDYLYSLATDRKKGFIAWLIKIFLFFLSVVYSLALRILIFISCLRPIRLNCKVISIGNITLGGTGKTSLVEFMAKYLRGKGHKIAILSRGYKKKSLGSSGDNAMGDEPYMLQRHLKDVPVIVDADRVRAGLQAINDLCIDTVILDDGFQQWRIKKDLDVIAIDATNPFGNQHLLPRGILREPLSSLKRGDVFILTKTNLNPDTQDIEDFLSSVNPKALIAQAVHRPVGLYLFGKNQELLHTDILKGKTVTLFCGIGDPDSFENLLISLGANIGLAFRFPDHYAYRDKDVEKIISASEEAKLDTIVTTEKDAVRLKQLQLTNQALGILVLVIELLITRNEQVLYNRLLRLY